MVGASSRTLCSQLLAYVIVSRVLMKLICRVHHLDGLYQHVLAMWACPISVTVYLTSTAQWIASIVVQMHAIGAQAATTAHCKPQETR